MPRILFIVPAIMMLAALAPMPFGYYRLLRLVTFAASLLIFLGMWRQGRVLGLRQLLGR